MEMQSTFPSPDWIKDCVDCYGVVLTGKCAHWCPDWDFLPIDHTCGEFACCSCDFEEVGADILKEEKYKEVYGETSDSSRDEVAESL